MFKGIQAVIFATILTISIVAVAFAGTIVMSSSNREKGMTGHVYMFNSLNSIKACMDEIRKTGGRGIICEDLSVPIKDGTKAEAKVHNGEYKYIIIQDGKYAGKAGYVSSDCYSEPNDQIYSHHPKEKAGKPSHFNRLFLPSLGHHFSRITCKITPLLANFLIFSS